MKKEKMKLGDGVEVMTGYSFRGKIESQEAGEFGILQMSAGPGPSAHGLGGHGAVRYPIVCILHLGLVTAAAAHKGDLVL